MTGSPKPLGQDAADKTNRHMESCFHVSQSVEKPGCASSGSRVSGIY